LPAPALILAWLLRARWLRAEEAQLRVLAALTLWGAGQLLVLSLMRGVLGRAGSWRHFDLHAVWIFVNVAALVILARSLFLHFREQRVQVLGAVGTALYAALLVGGVVNQCVAAREFLDNRRIRMVAEVDLVRAYLATGNRELLTQRPTDTPFVTIEKP
jgi:hypothetical protein